MTGEWFFYLGRGIGFFFAFLGRGFKKAAVRALPIMVWVYRRLREARLAAGRILHPAEQRFFYILANRYLVHFMVIVLVFFFMAAAGRADEYSAEGEHSLLFDLLQEDAIVNEHGLPSPSEITATDFFVDFPP